METTFPGRVKIPGGIYSGKGVGWSLGINSFDHPLFVHELQLRWMENGVTQGGFAQTRPGYKTRLTFDTTIQGSFANLWWIRNDGPLVHPQMCVRFRPSGGGEQLVFAISGTVFYASVAPNGSLGGIIEIPGFQFNPMADILVGCPCTQSATIIAGQYANNITPKNLLVIQDGFNRAGIWDGTVGIHMNPAKKITVTTSGDTLYPESWNQTRIGLWMAWSGNRLWLSNGPNVYASDLFDPTHFTEELKFQSVPVFTFDEEVTGMVDRGTSGNNRSQVVVFTPDTTETLWSGIQNRLPSTFGPGWAFTPDFRTKIFDQVGCVAGKSVVVHRGLLYWKSKNGLVLFDSTQTVNSSQNLPPIDSEMAYSKLRISPSAEGMDLTCAGKINNFVWWSVPVGRTTDGRRYNGHTQMLDRQTTLVRSTGSSGAFNASTTGWQGIWTGIRPVEWANTHTGAQERTYALSVEGGGQIHIWEAFQANRADNGQRIPWLVESRLHPVQPTIFEYATLRSFRLLLDQISGNLGIVGMWRGLKGNYHELLTCSVSAASGSVLGENGTVFRSCAMQGRTVRSRNFLGTPPDCSAQGVESDKSDATDHAFSLAIQFIGRGAISGYEIIGDSEPTNSEGTGGDPTGISEAGQNIVPQDGCPEHLDGETPTYTAPDQPRQLFACPYMPSAMLSVDYVAPVI